MTTQAFLLDLGRCIGCQACVVACKAGNELPFGAQLIYVTEKTEGTFPNLKSFINQKRCFHCTEAACVSVCPTQALYKENGLTYLDRSRCSGCAYCTDACPYDVPEMVEGLSSKCDGCADEVRAGGMPWCVKTCPSQALMYGDREEILAEARRRADALKERFPNAQVYGETEVGGLGLLVVLPDTPETFGLPVEPKIPLSVNAWQNVVQPASLGLTGLSIAVTGLAAFIARRNHLQEIKELHQSQSDAGQEEA